MKTLCALVLMCCGGMCAAQYTSKIIVSASNTTLSNITVTTTSGPCIQVGMGTAGGVRHVVIQNSKIGPCGSASQVSGDSGIYINGAQDVTIRNNEIHDVSDGIFAVNSYHPIKIHNNTFWNIRGPFPDGVAIAIASIQDAPGQSHSTSIKCNVIDDRMGSNAHSTDHINIGEFGGQPHTSRSSPGAALEIGYNKIRGQLAGGNQSGSGIQIQDSKSYENLWIHDNVIVEVNGCGICATGANTMVENNLVENNGVSADSLTLWPFAFGGNQSSCTTLTARNNRGVGRLWGYGNKGQAAYPVKPAINKSLCTALVEDGNNWNDTTLTADIWNKPIPQCAATGGTGAAAPD